MKRTVFLGVLVLALCTGVKADTLPYQNPELTVKQRVNDLLSRLTLKEKVTLMKHESPGVERLGIPRYNWWNEALHGVARTAERVTSFPQAIALAATFDAPGVWRVGDIASSEGRALFNEDIKKERTGTQYRGLTYWTPNVNIFRDPRWGRGQETYGEDPYLTSKMGAAMVRGLEGDNDRYLKAVACAKHYAVHSGPEGNRHTFNVSVSDYDLWDTYLPAFRELVTKAHVHGVMCAYNRFNGQPCCGNNELLDNILRRQWKFDGYITSDCWAINDFAKNHKTHKTDTIAVADAVLAGTDLECGCLYPLLVEAVEKGYISERDIDVSLSRLLAIQFRLGMFDPQERVPYSSIGREVIECKEHKEHALKMARESMVLLKNKKNILPLNSRKIKRMVLIGPNIDSETAMLANYFGTPSEIATPYRSLSKRFPDMVIDTITAVGIVNRKADAPSVADIIKRARKADVIVFVGGLNANYEGEAGDAGAAGYGAFAEGDRTTISLPKVQSDLILALEKTGRPVVLVNMSGSVIDFKREADHVDAILQAWYGGQAGGDAITDVLFGSYNPGGRMPLTTYMGDEDLPDFEDYSMSNRTYRYFKGNVRFPFGYGLSYTTFAYGGAESAATVETGKDMVVTATVTNTGKREGDEVVQLYVSHPQMAQRRAPRCALKGFARIRLNPGESRKVSFTLTPEDMALVDERGNLVEAAGEFKVYIGGGQPGCSEGVTRNIKIAGDSYVIH